jgi:hypothetical protein
MDLEDQCEGVLVDPHVDKEEEEESGHSDLIPFEEIQFEEDAVEDISQLIAKKRSRTGVCFACGQKGHTWRKCKVRSVERILAHYGILVLPDNFSDPRLKEKVSGNMLKRPHRSAPPSNAVATSPEDYYVPPAEQVIQNYDSIILTRSQRSRTSPSVKRPREDPNRKCQNCVQDFYHLTERDYNWRVFGSKCEQCGKFYCQECAGAAENCCNSQKEKKKK